MKIALDATPLSIATGGIRRYTEDLAAAWGATFPRDECSLLSASESWWDRRWWSFGLPLRLVRENFDVFHGTDFAVPYLPVCATVMTLHDLSPWKDEPWRNASQRVRRRAPFLLGLGLATMVVTPTEAIRREALLHFGLHSSRVRVVHEAAAGYFRPAGTSHPDRPYFLFVGTLDPRKNLAVAIEAWRSFRDVVDFVVAGRGTLPEEPGLRVLGPVPDEQLPELYSGAAALVFPSFYEGFGLPVIEAMQCGAPVIVSRDPALLEVAGAAALHADARSPAQWREAMRTVLRDPAPWRSAGLLRAAEFTRERMARAMRSVYDEAIRRHRGVAA